MYSPSADQLAKPSGARVTSDRFCVLNRRGRAPDQDDYTLYGPVRADVPGDLDSLSGDLESLLEDGMVWLNGHGFKRAYKRHRNGIENEALSWRRNRTFSALPKLENLNKKQED